MGNTVNADRQPQPARSIWRSLMGFALSALVHMALVIILALITLAAPPPPQMTVLAAQISEDAAPDMANLQDKPIELDQLETFVGPPHIDPTGFVSTVFAADSLAPGSATVGIDSGVGAPLVQVAELFSGGGKGMSAGKMPGSAEFFGVKSYGVKFVFIVDSSNSMKGGKFDAARQELSYAVGRLSSKQLFYVIFFDQDAYRMFDLKKPEPAAIPANSANLQRLARWLPTVENELKTDPYEAVKFAMEMLPDAIYILSDGKFTDKGRTERYLKVANAIEFPLNGMKAKVPIHTIAFWDKAGEPTLKSIAESSGGTYRFVPKP